MPFSTNKPAKPLPTAIRRKFERAITDQVFQQKSNKWKPRLTRLEKIFILRCLMERWSLALIAKAVGRSVPTIHTFRRGLLDDPERLFEIEGLYQIVGRDRRRYMIECTLCQGVRRTTELEMKMHIAEHVMPKDLVWRGRFL